MSMYEVHQIFVQSYDDLALGIPNAYENKDIEPPTEGIYSVINLLPDITDSLGKSGTDCDLATGIFQVSIYAPAGSNVGESLQLVDTILNFYQHGKMLTQGTQEVEIISSNRNGGRNTDGHFIIDITINYTATLERV